VHADLLAEERENPWGGGDWRPSVGDCIRVILEEEWAHLRYIRRDLARMRWPEGASQDARPLMAADKPSPASWLPHSA